MILPGGFSHGDYLADRRHRPLLAGHGDRCGLRAAWGPRPRICNGFQILLEAGLLPGAMLRNRDLKFHCEHVRVRVEQSDTPFTSRAPSRPDPSHSDRSRRGKLLRGTGRHPPSRARQADRVQHCDASGRTTAESNPNGSLANIAGICNDERNVVGLMPHPERACESALGSADGLVLFDSVVASLEAEGALRRA